MLVRWEKDGSITADDRVIGRSDTSFWSSKTTVSVDGQQWLFRKDWGRYVAEQNGQQLLSVKKTGFFSPHYVFQGASDPTLEIKSSGMFSSGYDIVAQGQVVSQVRKSSFWRNTPEAMLPASVPPAEAAFVLWLCRTLMEEASRSNNAASNR